MERIERLIFFDDDAKPEADSRSLTLSEIEQKGIDAGDSVDFEGLLAELRADDLATIIYTSGSRPVSRKA